MGDVEVRPKRRRSAPDGGPETSENLQHVDPLDRLEGAPLGTVGPQSPPVEQEQLYKLCKFSNHVGHTAGGAPREAPMGGFGGTARPAHPTGEAVSRPWYIFKIHTYYYLCFGYMIL